jgi:sodium/proline symporter
LTGQGLIEQLTGSNSETIIVKVAHLLSTHGVIPALMAGLILAGILASTMSTADSQLLAASSSVSQNILQEALHVNLSKKTNMLVARFTVIVIAILGVFIARDPDSSIFGIVSFAWAGFGAAFGPVVICALFWKRTTFHGALSGMLAGGVFVFVWKYLIKPLGGVFGIYELLPAFIVGLVVIVIVSLLTKAPSQEILDEFEHARSGREIEA